MNIIGVYDGMTLIWTVLGMLNGSIAMGVSEILMIVKEQNAK